jgi:hypothetical protein
MSTDFESFSKYHWEMEEVSNKCFKLDYKQKFFFLCVDLRNARPCSANQILFSTMRVLTDPEHISQHEDERAGPFAFYRVTYQIQPSVCCQNLILFVLEEGERNNIYRSTDEMISLQHHLLLMHLHAAH